MTGETALFVPPMKGGFSENPEINAIHKRNWKALERFLRDAKITGFRIAADTVTGGNIAPGTITSAELDPTVFHDGILPTSSPTPTVQGGVGFLAVKWTASTNPDPVVYDVHVSTTTGFTPSGATLAGTIDGTLFFIRKMPDGSALAYGTTYYVKIIARDLDGSGPASAQGSATLTQVNTADIAANAVTANEILAGAITAGKLESTLILATLIKAVGAAGRIEIDSAGIRGYDAVSAGNLTFELKSADGSALFTGKFRNGLSGTTHWEAGTISEISQLQGYVSTNLQPGLVQVTDHVLALSAPRDGSDKYAQIFLNAHATAPSILIRAEGASAELIWGTREIRLEAVTLGGGEARGFCAVQAYNDNATARQFGHGVTYGGVSKLTNVPSSITFTLVGTDSAGASAPTANDITIRGFLFTITVAGTAGGNASRTYVTVGN